MPQKYYIRPRVKPHYWLKVPKNQLNPVIFFRKRKNTNGGAYVFDG
jgi:hypothetical protein